MNPGGTVGEGIGFVTGRGTVCVTAWLLLENVRISAPDCQKKAPTFILPMPLALLYCWAGTTIFSCLLPIVAAAAAAAAA
jgi:hypothetical protein